MLIMIFISTNPNPVITFYLGGGTIFSFIGPEAISTNKQFVHYTIRESRAEPH